MDDNKAVAIVGLGAILPDAHDVPTFWQNLREGKYSITEVPPDRWDANLYYDPDPNAVDKTYSKLGGWVRDYQLEFIKWGIPIPPKTLAVMDMSQQWGIAASRQALLDYGYKDRKFYPERTAVIFGNAMGGQNHYNSVMRIRTPEFMQALSTVPEFQQLPEAVRSALLNGMRAEIQRRIPAVTEDTMPGELSSVIAGRVANVFNLAGPNMVTDAACASSIAAVQASVQGLLDHRYDMVVTGGVDRNMGVDGFVKFCRIGALSPDGSRPYADGANGFLMGEGAVVFLLKRLEEAEQDGDKIYAVIRGIGGSSDGKGKGITAPNPLGQQRAVERAWQDAGLSPATANYIEGHGTSTRVGDVVEAQALETVLAPLGLKVGQIMLGSVKSNIGHLKSAAGAAGMLKAILALHEKIVPVSVNFHKPNPAIDFDHLPVRVAAETQPWERPEIGVRRAGVSSFGFGGTNFHIVLEEYLPGLITGEKRTYPAAAVSGMSQATVQAPMPVETQHAASLPQGSALNPDDVKQRVLALVSEKTGYPADMLDEDLDLEADLGIDTVKQAELFAAVRGLYGIPRREDLKLSDYNTLAKVVQFVCQAVPSATPVETQHAASVQHAAPAPLSVSASVPGRKPYRGLLFIGAATSAELKQRLAATLEQARQGNFPPSELPDPAAVAMPERIAIDYENGDELIKRGDRALKGFENDTPNGWQALTAHGVFRGSGKPGKVVFMFPGQGSQYVNMLMEMRHLDPIVADTFREADEVMKPILGKPLTEFIFVEGDEAAMAQAEGQLRNTTITQPAVLTVSVALMRILNSYGFKPDYVIGHSLGEYAALVAAGVLSFGDALEIVSERGRAMANVSKEDNGSMAAISAPIEEVERILKGIDEYVVVANINSPLQSAIGGSTKGIDQAVAAFTAAGYQAVKFPVSHAFHTKIVAPAGEPLRKVISEKNVMKPRLPIVANVTGELYPSGREEILDLLAQQVASPVQFIKSMQKLYSEGVRIYVEVGPKRVVTALANDNLKGRDDVTILSTNHPRKGGLVSINEALCGLYAAGVGGVQPVVAEMPRPVEVSLQPAPVSQPAPAAVAAAPGLRPGFLPLTGSVVVSGAGLGLPGSHGHVFDDNNIRMLLGGEQRIEQLTDERRNRMLEKRVTRLYKSDAGATTEVITDLEKTIKLAGQRGAFDLVQEFGVPAERVDAYDISTQLAIGAGIDALRDAGIPLVMRYRVTSKGTYLPDRWMLPTALADETGVVFASAFPGLDRMAEETGRYYEYDHLLRTLEELRNLRGLVPASQVDLQAEFESRINEIEKKLDETNYGLDRRFVFRVLTMGHSQFAEYIGARGPNTHVNAACATTTHAVNVAEDWIRNGRCRRVIVIAGDDVTSGSLAEWIGSGLLASGATTTEGNRRMAVLPFDRRRNGMIMGMGAAALVLEAEDAVRERGMRAICEMLSGQIANSAFHGTRLDVQHVSEVMEHVVAQAEKRFGVRREQIAPHTVFVSHETYTPARGGSASAEIRALRHTFGDMADKVVIANTKGYTGHTMGVGVEDVMAVKALENRTVPPIANIDDGFEPDPELGNLNLSKGGKYPIEYALRLGAGFGSQIAMTLMRRIPGEGERINHSIYNRWLADVAGYNEAETEVVQHTLRVCNQGAPVKAPAASTWELGRGPIAWAMQAPPSAPAAAPAAIPAPVKMAAPVQIAPAPAAGPTPLASLPERTGGNSLNTEDVKQRIVALVSEKTGYPADMLDADLDLEADLGIDTVKQAELFAAVRGLYGIPRREDLKLADYNTLAKVVQFVLQAVPAAVPVATPQPAAAQPASVEIVEAQQAAPVQPVAAPVKGGRDVEEIKQHIVALVSEKTGYPAEMLDFDLDLEADLGIDTVKQAELFAAVRGLYGIPRREDLKLADYNTLAKVVQFVREAVPVADQPAPAAAVQPSAPSVAAQQATPVAPAAPVTPGSVDANEIKQRIVALVSEKTGYPADMLDADLDLEADLGIDTVKQAELFAAVRGIYSIPRREDLKLADYNTLAKVVQFVMQALQPAAVPVEVKQETPAPVAEVAAEPAVTEQAEPVEKPAGVSPVVRRIPMPVLRPRLDLCKPTGVTLDDSSRVVVVHDQGKVGEALVRRLRNYKVKFLHLREPKPEQIAEQVAGWLDEGPIQGVYFLPALDCEAGVPDLSPAAWKAELDRRLRVQYALMRALPREAFLVCGTRMGGLHGYGEGGASAPLGGAVSGFAKAYAMERPENLVKVVDFPPAMAERSIASHLIDETLRDPGAVEVGYEDDQRYTVGLIEQPLAPAQGGLELGSKTVFIVTGGAGGITVPVVTDLAQASHGRFYLTGRTAQPDKADADIKLLKSDREALKREIAARMKNEGLKPTPAKVDQKIAAIERAASILAVLEAVKKAGGRAEYHPCDVSDPAAVTALVDEVVKAEGRLDVIIHAAGVEQSRLLEKKTPEEFERVFTVKADGFFNLLKEVERLETKPKAVVAFTSVAGRFGNNGQTDYSAANDLLSELVNWLRANHPEIRALSLDWGAWADVGMASRGSLPELMKLAGIELLPPETTAPLVRAELTSTSPSGEVVLAGTLGALMASRDPDAGLDLERANIALTEGEPIHEMLSRLSGYDLHQGISLETELDPTAEPFLRDHAMNGVPVLPGVIGIEGFAVASTHVASVLGASKAGFTVTKLEDIRFMAPFKFYRNEPRRITWRAQVVKEGEGLVAHVSLESTLALKTRPNERMRHFSGRVYLQPVSVAQASVQMVKPPAWNGGYTVDAQTIYRLYFHGPAFQVLDGVQRAGDVVLGRLNRNLPAFSSRERQSLSAPVLIELCLQTAGVWEIGTTGTLALPMSIGRLDIYDARINGEAIYAEVNPIVDDGQLCFDARVVDALGHVFLEMKNYRTSPLPYKVEEELIKPLKALVEK